MLVHVYSEVDDWLPGRSWSWYLKVGGELSLTLDELHNGLDNLRGGALPPDVSSVQLQGQNTFTIQAYGFCICEKLMSRGLCFQVCTSTKISFSSLSSDKGQHYLC